MALLRPNGRPMPPHMRLKTSTVSSALVLMVLGLGGVSSAQQTEWAPGIPGGIPTWKISATVGDFGAVGDGHTEDAAAFQAAIDSVAGTNGVVFVPEGTYRLERTLNMRSGTVLRGAGAAKTKLVFDLGGSFDPSIRIASGAVAPWVGLIGSPQRGSVVVRVADASLFEPGTFAETEQANDPEIMYTNEAWDQEWAKGAVGEALEVLAVDGNRLILKHPLSYSYRSDLDPRIRAKGLLTHAGVEDLRIGRLDSGDANTIEVSNAAWVWVRGVESEMTSRSHVRLDTVLGCEIRDSFFHRSHEYGNGGHGYGIELVHHTNGCLVENNIFVMLRHAMMVHIGSSNNVFGYNYSREPFANGGFEPPDVSFHGHYPAYNLVEGNVVEELTITDFWGPAGPENTVLRNCITQEGINLKDHSHQQRVIGNYLEVVGALNFIEIDPTVEDTFVHGNFTDNGLQWDPGTPDRTIPDSYYLTSKPPFFGSMDWPSIGGDLAPTCTNPAKERWLAGEATPRPSVGSMTRRTSGRRVANP